jgi:hypothetical protein
MALSRRRSGRTLAEPPLGPSTRLLDTTASRDGPTEAMEAPVLTEWDARAWVASQVGCDPDDLSVSGQTRARSGIDTDYERGGNHAATLILTGPMSPLDGSAERSWVVTLELALGGVRMGPDDLSYAAAIGF